jgi:hypothetical protein
MDHPHVFYASEKECDIADLWQELATSIKVQGDER